MEEAPELGTTTRFRLAFERVGMVGLVVGAALVLVDIAVLTLHRHLLAFDAANSYLPAARDLLQGRSPYHAANVANGTAFGSPPIAAFVYAPFLVLPKQVADFVMALLALGCVAASLRIVGLRDWRCYAAAALSFPLVSEFQTANLSALLAVCGAVVWRYRDKPLVSGFAAGSMIALKLFGWPFVLFLIATRRFRASAFACVAAVAGIVVPWAAVGFVGIHAYPHVLSLLMHAERGQAYAIGGLFASQFSWATAEITACSVGAALLVAAFRASTERVAYAMCVAASLAFSPIVWPHYMILLLVPLAISVPTMGPAWLVPLAFWFLPGAHAAHAWEIGVALAVQAALLAAATGRHPPTLVLARDDEPYAMAAPLWERESAADFESAL